MRPMSINPRDSFAAGVPLADRAAVSMAITEDEMFIPPSPVARTFKGSGLRPADRPSSAAYQRQPSIAVSEDLVPPSPGFRSFDGNPGDRPKSAMYQRQPSEDSLIAPARSFDDRPRSVGYQRSPSEDSIFVASPTTMANEPVILPPPPQRQAPPPPLRLAPQAPPQRSPPPPPESPQRQQQSPSPQPHRQASRDSMASVRLTDDQFAPGTSSPGPIPRPRRQPSNNDGLFAPREYTGRPGDRPQSFAPGPDGLGLTPPTPAFHSDGGRPKSIA